MYILNTFDRHYFGFFNELEPPVLSTTSSKNYYKLHNMPFKTHEEVKLEHEIWEER